MTKDELNKVRDLSHELANEQRRLATLNDWLVRLTAELDGLPHQDNANTSKLTDLIAMKIDCEKNIQLLRQQCADSKLELLKHFDDKLDDSDQRFVVTERHCFNRPFTEIASVLQCSMRTIYRSYKKALQKLNVDFDVPSAIM